MQQMFTVQLEEKFTLWYQTVLLETNRNGYVTGTINFPQLHTFSRQKNFWSFCIFPDILLTILEFPNFLKVYSGQKNELAITTLAV